MNKKYLLFAFCILSTFTFAWSQQQDVPEPVFMNFTIQPLYIPNYHGRDPFRPLDNVNRSQQISISELDYHGVLVLGNTSMAMFSWKGNPAVRYTLKFRKLYGGDKVVDGVVGDITDANVILVQADQKIVYPRR